MAAYYISVFGVGWLVDFLMMMAVKQLYPGKGSWTRTLIAATLGGLYPAVCLSTGARYLAKGFFPVLIPFLVALSAFGLDESTLKRCSLYLILRLSLSGLAQTGSLLRPWTVLLSSGLLLVLCVLGLPHSVGMLVPVELRYGPKCIRVTALRDTGNTLRDPASGKPVLVLGADAAQELTGLSPQQLRTPVESMEALPGLRLIPYRAICGSGLLLALRIQNLQIGDWSGSGLVAFAPEVLSLEGKFQALTGGVV